MTDSSEAPEFLGAGDGTDSPDFLADLQSTEIIELDWKPTQPTEEELEVRARVLGRLGEQGESYGLRAWCAQKFSSHPVVENRYFRAHAVVL